MPAAIGELKFCPKCKETKHISEYYKLKSASDGLHKYCKTCTHQKQVRQKNKELLASGQKRCPVCQETKSISEFYKATSNKDGLDSRCKECRKAYERTDARKKVVHKYTEKPEVKKKILILRKEHRSTEQYKESTRRYNQSASAKERQARQRKTIEVAARRKVNNAARDGRIPHISTQKCVMCNAQAAQYHHHNGYDKEHWLDVIPVCVSCHEHIHSK